MHPTVLWNILGIVGLLLSTYIVYKVLRRALYARLAGDNGELFLMSVSFIASAFSKITVFVGVAWVGVLSLGNPEIEWTLARVIVVIFETMLVLGTVVEAFVLRRISR